MDSELLHLFKGYSDWRAKGERRSECSQAPPLLRQRKPYLTGSPPSRQVRRCRQECRVSRVYRGFENLSEGSVCLSFGPDPERRIANCLIFKSGELPCDLAGATCSRGCTTATRSLCFRCECSGKSPGAGKKREGWQSGS